MALPRVFPRLAFLVLLASAACSQPEPSQSSAPPPAVEPVPPAPIMDLPDGWVQFGRVSSDKAPGVQVGHPHGWTSRGRGDWNGGALLLQAPREESDLLAFQCQWFAKDQDGPAALLGGENGLVAFIAAGFPGAAPGAVQQVTVMGEERTLQRFDHPPHEGKTGETLLLTQLDLDTHWVVAGGLLQTDDLPTRGPLVRQMLGLFTVEAPDRARPLPRLPADHPAAAAAREGSATAAEGEQESTP